jgi:Mg-chelatase subunit ChlD/uncharacterized membrane protein
MSISFIYPEYLWLLLLLPLTLVLGVVARRSLTRLRFWGGLTIRTSIMLAIIFALAGIQLRLSSNVLTTVFILDFSDSVPIEEQARGEALILNAIQNMETNDRAAIVVFGKDALVERLPFSKEMNSNPRLASVPVTTRTNIAGALQLAQAILPGEGAKRMVLLSDGRQNLGEAIKQAELAASHDTELLYVPLGNPQGEVEVWIQSLEAPADVRQGEGFDLTVVIHSTIQQNASLRLFENDHLAQTREISLQAQENRVSFTIDTDSSGSDPHQAAGSGFRRFRVQVIPDADTRLQNNQASAFTVIHGPPSVLLVEGQKGEGENLANALEANEMRLARMLPSQIPTSLAELAAYQAVILVNVNAASLPSGVMEIISSYVRDLGMGLVMIGGSETYGAGGYLRTPLEDALPVNMDVRNKELQANLALVLAVDKSGSMGRCHCDNPDLNQTYTRVESGQPKVDIAKEAVMRSASALGEQDYLGVIAFDSQPHWVLDIDRLVDASTLERAIGSFQAEGQTNLQAGVEAAYKALENVPAKRKHIILMTDGWVRQGDLTPLAQEMQAQGITLSIIAAGEGSAEYLATLAQIGGGRYYPARDILEVPDIFLKETITSVGQYIIEEPFYPLTTMPSSILRGLDTASMPPLLGYNGTTAKNTARLDLITPRGDPLLATWQYGLGRSAAWTSDLKGQWAREWLAWPDFSRFISQLVGWVLPAPKVEGLTAGTKLQDDQALITLDALDKSGHPLNFLDAVANIVEPDLQVRELPLQQTGAGKYQASPEASKPGTYLIRLGVNQNDQSLGQLTMGLVVPYSPEYKTSGVDRGLLSELASITGGSELLPDQSVFVHNIPSTATAREIWQPLLLLTALLFPLDVAIRRLMLGPKDLQKGFSRIIERLPIQRKGALDQQPRLLSQLFNARERARQRETHHPKIEENLDRAKPTRPGSTTQPPSQQAPDAQEIPTQRADAKKTSSQTDPGDSIERLRQAKKRARR